MKKVNILIGMSLILITACMIYLVYSGISLRSAPLIQPSAMDADQHNVAVSTVHRLHQDFEAAHYVVFGVLPETDETSALIRMLAEEYEKVFKSPVRFVSDDETLTPDVLQSCAKPCWVFVNRESAHELDVNDFTAKKIRPLQRPYFNLTFVDFTGDETVSETCNSQKRLSFDCLVPVAVREVHRKLKDPAKRYFFLRRYNAEDFFLFLQKPQA